ncbi:MAG TPA: hypothetical protein VMT89_05810, partial [Candidatus Acidoferrales bacterium]|nr:hypothetical protein [Candidatus Acidoferrales bacterium]
MRLRENDATTNISAVSGGVNSTRIDDARDALAAIFPGALGDFLCWVPTLCALRQRHRGRLVLVARPSLLELVKMEDITPVSVDRRELTSLFGAESNSLHDARSLLGGLAHVYSWTGHADARFTTRLSEVTAGRASVFPFRAIEPGEHAVDYFARCVGTTVEVANVYQVL